MQEIKDYQIFNDVSFWINIVVGLVSSVVLIVVGSIKKNQTKLFERTENNAKDIAVTQKDLENHRKECEGKHKS